MSDELPPSFNAQIKALAVGEIVAKVAKVEDGGNAGAMIERLRNGIAPAASRAAKAQGKTFTVDHGTFFTAGGHEPVAVVCVTRTA